MTVARPLLAAAVALFLGCLPLALYACECPDWPPSPNDPSDTLFRGTILRELKADRDYKKFVVSVQRIYTGCTFKAGSRVVVKTGAVPEICGLDLNVDWNYVFAGENVVLDASTQKQLNGTKISRAVTVNACTYTRWWDEISNADKRLLRAQNTTCPKSCDADIDCVNKRICKRNKCVVS